MIEMPVNTKPLWLQGDVLERLADIPDDCIQCCVTSPPYWGLRDYQTATWKGGDPECDHKIGRFETPCSDKQKSNTGSAGHQASSTCPKCGAIRIDKQIGLESTLNDWIDKIVEVFREVRRVLRPDGTLWLNIGDAYTGSNNKSVGPMAYKYAARGTDENADKQVDGLKPKDCLMMDYRLALALQADGWWVRSKICWSKNNPMPESVGDRPTSSYELIFLLTKSARYFYDADAIREGYSDATIERLSQSTFDTQTGGPKDPKTGNRSCRKALENLKTKHADSDYGGGGSGFKGHSGYKDSDGNILVNPSGRNARNVWVSSTELVEMGIREQNTDPQDIWKIPTHPNPLAHFATFPPELVRRCIAAGTSEKGCCKKCGKPWERVTEKSVTQHHGDNKAADLARGRHGKTSVFNTGESNITKTLGFRPGCDCDARYPTTRPCIVLDIFAGIGTTLAVAARMGRASIGIELNPQYIKDGLPDVEAAFKGITRKEVEAGQEIMFE